MARYIEADKFRKELIDRQITVQFFNPRERHEIGCIVDMLDNAPTADVVEVVRCKDCKHWKGRDFDGCCIMNGLATRIANDFCSYGERKGDAE